LGEYLASGVRVQEYVWLDDTIVAVLSDHDGTTYQYVQTDHLGTPRAIINPVNNAIIWRWNLTNTAFGEHAPVADPDGNTVSYTFNMRYPGQWYDSESKLHYNYLRDYDPATGRYVESDPVGQSAGFATYGYVGQRPLIGIDPTGLLEYLVRKPYRLRPLVDGNRLPAVPGGIRPRPADITINGRTYFDWSVRASCSCDADKKTHRLDSYSVSIGTIVRARSQSDLNRMAVVITPPTVAWVLAAEEQHVADFESWADSFMASALSIESSRKSIQFGSDRECRAANEQSILNAMSAGAEAARAASALQYDGSAGSHAWRGVP
jgi:RHS repeat-associated protein